MEVNGNASVSPSRPGSKVKQDGLPSPSPADDGSLSPKATTRARSHSQSSSSSLSSLDEKVMGDDFESPRRKFASRGSQDASGASRNNTHTYTQHGDKDDGNNGDDGEVNKDGSSNNSNGNSLSNGNSTESRSQPTSIRLRLSSAFFNKGTKQHKSPYISATHFAEAAAETLAAHNQRRPISAPPKPGPKTFIFSTTPRISAAATTTATANATTPTPASASPARAPSSSSSNTTHANPHPPSANHAHGPAPTNSSSDPGVAASSPPAPPLPPSSMAPAVLLPTSSNSSSTSASASASGHHATLSTAKGKQQKNPPKAVQAVSGEPYDANDRTSRMKRQARDITNRSVDARESFDRHQVPLVEDVESASDGGGARSIAVKSTKRPTKVRLLTREAKRYNYDSEDHSSPTLLSFQPDLAPGSRVPSRAGTPNNSTRPTRKSKPGSGLRVKTSPMKKKGGTLAGIPRASGERNSPTTNGAPHNQDDNDDYCSSCGGNGDLVCCDGCTRSFHFKCVDPPMIEGSLPDEWYCNVCQSARKPRHEEDEYGAFGALLFNLDRKNPSAFHLPKDIREYFENVKTGTEGEYEEGVPPKTKNRAGYEDTPDYYRLKDSKGKTILCHNCNQTASAPDRMIIPCSFCGLYWHMDCLPIPLAKEPAPGRQWRCPAHVDDLLTQIPEILAPAHRFRRIKGASSIRPAIARGTKNNGHIEIDFEPSDNEEEQVFYEQKEYGHVYKLPERGIKLDFLSKVKMQNGGFVPGFGMRKRVAQTPSPDDWNHRKVTEQQAALNLASLVTDTPGVSDASLLINALLSEAPPNVIALMAQGRADTIKEKIAVKDNKQSLLAMKALIDNMLANDDDAEIALPNGSSRLPTEERLDEDEEKGHADEDTEMLL